MELKGVQSNLTLEQLLALPPLREDLLLHEGAPQRDGAPSWIIEDPLKGRYYQIGWLEFEILRRWHLGHAKSVVDAVMAETLLIPALQEVFALRQFLTQHELLHNQEALTQAATSHAKRSGFATRLLHNYLMFRLPLVNPDLWLARWLPTAEPFLRRKAFIWSMGAGALGLLLALQQWDRFVASFVDTLSLQGLFSYFLALSCAKILHELGHAFTAKSLGLRVPRIGVAIVLLLPMLYTDTGETWRLTKRRERFAIAAAGMRIELMLAAWSTLAWSLLPDGPLRGAFFFLGTTSWFMTFAINASPFMRFDGYYMMSDATGIPNLHDQASKNLRIFLRRNLLGIQEPQVQAPAWLVWFGMGTAIYRFFLFLGIAVTVYHYFFKVLGIFLFAVEIWWFILRPISSELRHWWRERDKIAQGSALRLAIISGALIFILLLPWQAQVQGYGWLRSAQDIAIYTPRSARLVAMPASGYVNAQDPIASLESADLQLRMARASAKIGAIESRLLAGNGADQAPEPVRSTREQLLQQWVEVSGADAEARQLEIIAPFSGLLLDVAPDLVKGQIVGRQEALARLVDPTNWIAEVYLDEEEVRRVHVGAKVRTYIQGAHIQVVDGEIEVIDTSPLDVLPSEMLAVRFGGPIATTDDLSILKPMQVLYRVRINLNSPPLVQQARLASFNIEGERASLLGRMTRALLSALILQMSF